MTPNDFKRLRTTPDDSRRLRTTSNDSERLQTTPNDSGRLRTIPDDFERLRTTSDDSERLRTTPNDSGRLRIRADLVVPFCQSRNRTNNSRSRIGRTAERTLSLHPFCTISLSHSHSVSQLQSKYPNQKSRFGEEAKIPHFTPRFTTVFPSNTCPLCKYSLNRLPLFEKSNK